MRRIALVSLTLTLSGCGFSTWWNPPLSSGYNPNAPVGNGVNMGRVMGQGVAVKPLTTEPGDIWPGPLPPPRTLQNLERQGGLTMQPAAPTRGSPLNRGGNPLIAPLPNAPAGTGTATPSGAAAPPTPGSVQPDRRIIVPNGNGTSTVIHPDGRIETIPTPK